MSEYTPSQAEGEPEAASADAEQPPGAVVGSAVGGALGGPFEFGPKDIGLQTEVPADWTQPLHVPLPGFNGRVLHLADLLHLAHRLAG
jgi:hypothetical protein